MDIYRIDLGKHRMVFFIFVSSGSASGIPDLYLVSDIMGSKDVADLIEFLNRNTLINFFPIPD